MLAATIQVSVSQITSELPVFGNTPGLAASQRPALSRWVGVYLYRRRVQTEGFDLEPQNLLLFQFCEHLIQHTLLGPAIHAHIDTVPIAEPARQSSPLAPVLSNVQDGIQQNQVVMMHVATLHRQAICNSLVLLVWEFSKSVRPAFSTGRGNGPTRNKLSSRRTCNN
jgi:hypothetical protein